MWIIKTWNQGYTTFVMRSDGVVFWWDYEQEMYKRADSETSPDRGRPSQPVPGCGPTLDVAVHNP